MKHLDDERNLPEDDQVYAWKDPIDPDDMPDKWTVDDYEYQQTSETWDTLWERRRSFVYFGQFWEWLKQYYHPPIRKL
jgi:hypothetical protein